MCRRCKVETATRQWDFEVPDIGGSAAVWSGRFRNSVGDDVKHVQTARWLWEIVTDVNEAIIPGRGKLFGLGKRDWIQPWDAIPFVGPISKANKARKIAKSERVTMYVVAGIGMAADLLKVAPAVVWYNSRYRTLAEAIEEESPSLSQSGNADDKINGGGGTQPQNQFGKGMRRQYPTKAGKRIYRMPPVHRPGREKKGFHLCSKGYRPKKIKGKWYCVERNVK